VRPGTGRSHLSTSQCRGAHRRVPWYRATVSSTPAPNGPTITEPGDLPVYDEDGVDRSLIRYMLRLTATERLEYLRAFVELHQSARPAPDEPR